METGRPQPAADDAALYALRASNPPLFRLLLAFGLSVPMLAAAFLAGGSGRVGPSGPWSAASWAVCGLLAGWNGLEYALGRAAHGAATPPWLRWLLAAPYVAITWVGVRTVAAMVAGLAYLAAGP